MRAARMVITRFLRSRQLIMPQEGLHRWSEYTDTADVFGAAFVLEMAEDAEAWGLELFLDPELADMAWEITWHEDELEAYYEDPESVSGEDFVSSARLTAERFQRIVAKYGLRPDWSLTRQGGLIYFVPVDPVEAAYYRVVNSFTWHNRLVENDIGMVYDEICAYFAHDDSKLDRIHWRAFERLIEAVMRNSGFETELGPGTGDEGIDLRAVWHSSSGPLTTLIQVKRYKAKHKVTLESVAALEGVRSVARADNALFITSSTFLPVARRFAAKTKGRLRLIDGAELRDWMRRDALRYRAEQEPPSIPESFTHFETFSGYSAGHDDWFLFSATGESGEVVRGTLCSRTGECQTITCIRSGENGAMLEGPNGLRFVPITDG